MFKAQNPYDFTLNLGLQLYTDHLHLVFSMFCIPKNILYDQTFAFRIKQIDKCFVIFILYEIKSSIILAIFKEWLVLSHLYLLLFCILIIFPIFWLFITPLAQLIGYNECCELYSTEKAFFVGFTLENNKSVTGKYIGYESARKWIRTGQVKWRKRKKIQKTLLEMINVQK